MKCHGKKKEQPDTATPHEDPAESPATRSEPEAEPADPSAAEPAAPDAATPAPVDRAAELETRLLRLQADFDNHRKRTIRERAEWSRRANEDLLLDLLPVLDHVHMAIKSAEQHEPGSGLLEGFRIVADQMTGVLNRFGLTVVDAHGQPFDPSMHEAIAHLPADNVPEGMVTNQTRRGYRWGDRVLRPAQVIVSSGPAAEAPGAAPTDSLPDNAPEAEASGETGAMDA